MEILFHFGLYHKHVSYLVSFLSRFGMNKQSNKIVTYKYALVKKILDTNLPGFLTN